MRDLSSTWPNETYCVTTKTGHVVITLIKKEFNKVETVVFDSDEKGVVKHWKPVERIVGDKLTKTIAKYRYVTKTPKKKTEINIKKQKIQLKKSPLKEEQNDKEEPRIITNIEESPSTLL